MSDIPCWLLPLIAGISGLILGWLLRGISINDLRKKISQRDQQIDTLTSEKNDFHSKWKVADQDVLDKQKMYDNLDKEYGRLAIEKRELIKENELKATEIASFAAAGEASKEDSQKIDTLSRELEEARASFSAAKAERDEWKGKAETAAAAPDNSAELNTLKRELEEARSSFSAAKAQRDEWKTKAENASATPDNSAEMDTLKRELDEARSHFSAAKAERDEWKAKAESTPAASDNTEELDKLRRELGEARSHFSSAKAERDEWKAKAESSPTANDNSAELDSLRKQLEQSQNDLSSTKTDRDKWKAKAEGSGSSSSGVASAAALSGSAFAAGRSDGSKKDDLTKIEGIGPKINQLLNAQGIWTFADLANTKVDFIKQVLDDAGPRYRVHDPGTWPRQSAMARDGKWDELNAWQDKLDHGKETN